MLLGHKPKNSGIKALKRAESTLYRNSRLFDHAFLRNFNVVSRYEWPLSPFK